MAITTVRIHPSIGIARLGNSPELFIGPTRPHDTTPPAGGYKDAQCRVKRQAAQFRLFAYDENGALVKEITAADGTITWTAHLVNRKAASDEGFPQGSGPRNPSIGNPADRAKLVIDPGPRTIVGPNQLAAFNNGTFTLPGPFTATVPLGEIRTDTGGRLLVLGGAGKSASPNGTPINDLFNNENWYDDVSDGPVSATVTIDGNAFTAVGSWVIVAPPKFAPPIVNSITLWDRLFQFFIDEGLLPPFNDPSPSYVRYISPILRSAIDIYGVYNVFGSHEWTEPVIDDALRQAIFARLNPPSNMPVLAGGAKLTATQYAIMQKWHDGNFTDDWPPPAPALTPEGMDRAALEAAVGAAFYPGIEAGDFLVTDPASYSEPFRLDHATVVPGKVTERMSLPWQTDFFACSNNWWPPQRPYKVIPSGTSAYVDWARGVSGGSGMVDNWSILGFVVDQAGQLREVERCDTPFIHLLTPFVEYRDIPQAPMGMSRKAAQAIVFEVGAPTAAVTLEYVSGPSHPRLQRQGGSSITVGPTGTGSTVNARLWIVYETGPVGEVLNDTVVVREPVSGQQWTIQITANTVARKKAAAALVLDRSGSMNEDRGDGQKKIDSLRQAAAIFVDTMLQDDAVALVRFSSDAQVLAGVTTLGPPNDPGDPGRTTIKSIINGNQLDPGGATSIGDGIFEGRNALDAATGFDVNSLVVLTDGVENQPKFIADVASSINELTYAIGLGKPENISVAALQTISGNNGGYLLVTGPITGDNQFVLQKYFLQILAGISNAEIVLDPQGRISAGEVVQVPFELTEADAGVDVILLTPDVKLIEFYVQTPAGYLLGPAQAPAHHDVQYVQSDGITYYRIRLPFEYLPDRFQDRGTWRAVLRLARTRGGARAASEGDDAVESDNPLVAAARPLPLRRAGPPPNALSARDFPGARPAVENDAAGIEAAAVARRSVPYSIIVHAYSDIRLRATAGQSGTHPGEKAVVHASVTEYDVPIERDVAIWADVTEPGARRPSRIDLRHTGEHFETSFVAAKPGVHTIRIQAAGRTTAGSAFRRELTLTAPVFYEQRPGGDGDGVERDPRWLLEHFIKGELASELVRNLKKKGVDIHDLFDKLKKGKRSKNRDEGGDDESA